MIGSFKEIEKAFDKLVVAFLKRSKVDEDDIYYNGNNLCVNGCETFSQIVNSAKECGFEVESAESRYLNGDVVYHAEIIDESNEWAFEIQYDEEW